MDLLNTRNNEKSRQINLYWLLSVFDIGYIAFQYIQFELGILKNTSIVRVAQKSKEWVLSGIHNGLNDQSRERLNGLKFYFVTLLYLKSSFLHFSLETWFWKPYIIFIFTSCNFLCDCRTRICRRMLCDSLHTCMTVLDHALFLMGLKVGTFC